MSAQDFFLSRPGVCFPTTRVDNAEVIRRVRARFRGSETQWASLQGAIEHMFGLCKTRERFLDERPEACVADYAVAAAEQCLTLNRAARDEIDLLVCGGIARQYFEPATAMEVAAKLGLARTHAFDVTSACVGHLEAVQTAAAYLCLHQDYRTALICTSELSGNYLDYDIQSVSDLSTKFAGLTIGNAAACVLLAREPWPEGSLRLRSFSSHASPHHWHLCKVPIDGALISSSVELMRLRKLVPPLLLKSLEGVGWKATDVDHFVFHQPSEQMIGQLLEDVGADPSRAIYTHHRYGNTASASIGVTFERLLQERDLRPGDKVVLGSAAAGFSVVVATGEWVAPRARDGSAT
jgi:3-oxoacyl-[acyl-carrier-protein] synthase III